MSAGFPKLRLRAVLAPGVALGPGKADLLEGIRDTGSIRAAGRRLSMSYKRAWTLVGELNRGFDTPLVETDKGGAGGGGGARLTPFGEDVLGRFRAAEQALAAAALPELSPLIERVISPLDPPRGDG
ncbi:LysR family transcriptional regulator [Stappia sp. F7233]|uniref:LysR family transcriptional regulator n=1 Tax=Stappia albiluteola TaxID=2758565 RepID=A0A839AE43_9HYPH|nr:LysR family transcriptional regulator [Stappia albiluteola]MBA5777406.1 LysR family transcriptional regulator [Stappia albiluteola]